MDFYGEPASPSKDIQALKEADLIMVFYDIYRHDINTITHSGQT